MIIKVKVKTSQPSFSVKKGDVWVIALTSKPEKNKANQELVRELSKTYACVKIVSGLKSKNKVLDIAP
jgi:uncharacterized protein YggU (UPF0235/DUF167 family)